MKRLSFFVSSVACGAMLLAALLHAMDVASERLLPNRIEPRPDCAFSSCAAEHHHASRLVCRAA